MVRWFWTSLALLFLPRLAAVAETPQDECGLYMAESSTSTVEEPKWGIFAGRDIPKSETISSDVAVQIHNMMAHTLNKDTVDEEVDEKKPLAARAMEHFEQFIWVAEATAGISELPPNEKVLSAIPGPGVLGSYNPRLINSEWNHSLAFFRPNVGEIREKAHPGRGAYSTFYDVSLSSTVDIPCGHEIFMDYGDNWEDEEEEVQLDKSDHDKVDQVIDSMIEFLNKYKEELTPDAKQEIYDFVMKDVVGAAAGGKKGVLILDLLPKNPDDLHKVKEAGGSLMFKMPKVVRTREWLHENGRCIDNLVMGPSQIPNAGRGAFAKRAIPKGGLISPVPLVHIQDKSLVNMYELSEDRQHRENDNVIGQQLLLNYCYGHPKSSLLFFPSGAVTNLINHDAKKANAKLVWSSHSNHHADWFQLTPEELLKDEHAFVGLMMEVVATRDIQSGEEVLLDYGPEWQAAWDKHVKEWKKKKLSKWPVRAVDLNEDYRRKPHKTQSELKTDPIPENVALKCFLVVKAATEKSGIDTAQLMDKYDVDAVKQWTHPKKGTAFDARHLFDCDILDRQDTKEEHVLAPYNYTVTYRAKIPAVAVNVPHQALVFVDRPGTGDQFTSDPFRHYIGIPDDIFPQGPWRDVA